MRRLFWMGVGAAVVVVAARRARRVVRSLPDAVVHQVEDATERASSALRSAVADFGAARAERERELVEALLTEPAGGTERRPRTRPAPAAAWDDEPDWDDDDV